MSVAKPERDASVVISPPEEALRRARPLPPRQDLVDENLTAEEWACFQEALAEA
ncbi:MAG: hypothetical protein ACYDAQ_10910 [Mycobacteriales bacterium]